MCREAPAAARAAGVNYTNAPGRGGGDSEEGAGEERPAAPAPAAGAVQFFPLWRERPAWGAGPSPEGLVEKAAGAGDYSGSSTGFI